jgi:integrase
VSPRPRKPKNRALPQNLYPANGGKSFMYRHPITGKRHGMGASKAQAIAAAKELNAMLIPDSDLVAKVLGRVTLNDHIDWFYVNVIPDRDYKAGTLGTYQAQMNKLRNSLGTSAVEDVSVQDLAELMEAQSARTANQFRQVATDLFRAAMSRGLRDDNPAQATLKRRERKARQRLAKAQFDSIRAVSKPWMRNAMDLALVTLQRRNDVAGLKFDDVRDGILYVVQGKTEKHDTGYLAITVGPALLSIIRRCRDDVMSPYMVHRKPQRKIKDREGMDHWTQVAPDMLTRTFATARDECGLFAGIDAAALPTFHEIRALGIKLYRDQGIEPQRLAGHSTAKMTSNYDSGHDEVRWVEVSAELQI